MGTKSTGIQLFIISGIGHDRSTWVGISKRQTEVLGWEPTGGEEEEEEEELAMGNMLYLFIKRVISSSQ